jgi:gas vesicle protein
MEARVRWWTPPDGIPEKFMTKRLNQIGMGVSLLATIGAGAALMYVFDPDRGRYRRKRISRSVHDLGETAAHLRQRLKDRAGHLADHASEVADKVRRQVHARSNDRISDGIAAARRVREAAERPIRDHYRRNQFAGYSATALGALAIGAAAVLLSNPERRNRLFSGAGVAIQRAGRSFRAIGKSAGSRFEQLASHEQGYRDPVPGQNPVQQRSHNGPKSPAGVATPAATPL